MGKATAEIGATAAARKFSASIAFISSKSGVDPCRDGRVSSLTRKECRQTDRRMAFQLYIVDYLHACSNNKQDFYFSNLTVR